MANSGFGGSIDTISSKGYVEGWAISNDTPYETVSVSIFLKDKPVGIGVANLFRLDLLKNEIGHGWHAFRIQVEEQIVSKRQLRLSLHELTTGSRIAAAELPCPMVFSRSPINVDLLLEETDLEVTDISTLRLANPAIDAFIARHGVEEFVDRGYCYILGRPADPTGMANYAKLIASGKMAPLAFLSALFNSVERRESKWSVLAPSDPGFIFAPTRSG